MNRLLIGVILLFVTIQTNGQPLSNSVIISNYNSSQKRLLITSAGRFINLHLPEFIPYLDERFDTPYNVRFKLHIEQINPGISQAMLIALIINEPVTNSIKYAILQNKNGIIKISMHQEAGQIALEIADNGTGLYKAAASAPPGSLGLKLIKG